MAILKKEADELNPGDIVIGTSPEKESVVIWTRPMTDGQVEIQFGLFGCGTTIEQHPVDAPFRVKVSDKITAAQQNAEELAEMAEWLWKFINRHTAHEIGANSARFTRLTALIDATKPPEPPTLEEALEALSELTNASPRQAELSDKRLDILHRARHAGLLK